MTTFIKCRARSSFDCYHGQACTPIYGEDSMADDGLFDGKTVICDPCYLEAGQPSVYGATSRQQVIDYVNKQMGLK